jgi:hypothetical protein
MGGTGLETKFMTRDYFGRLKHTLRECFISTTMNKGPHLSSILKSVEQQQLPGYVLVQSSLRVKLLYHRPIVPRFSMSVVM